MALALKQVKSQKQQVTKSPELIKAIRLLGKSNHEAEETMDQQLDLVTAEETSLEKRYHQDASQGESDRIQEESVPEVTADGQVNDEIEWDDFWRDDETGPAERQEENRQKEIPLHERAVFTLTHELQSHLTWQLIPSKLNPVQKELAVHIIGNLNEDGYLEYSIEEIRQDVQRYEPETWLETLRLIQNFDPVGVAARDIRECLLIHVRRSSKSLRGTIVETIIKNHWENVLHKRCDIIAKSLSVPLSDVHAALSVISEFDRRPGQRYNSKIYYEKQTAAYSDAAFHVEPELYISKDGDDYKIEPEHRYVLAVIGPYYHEKMNYPEASLDVSAAGRLLYTRRKRGGMDPCRFKRVDPLSLNDIRNLTKKLKQMKKPPPSSPLFFIKSLYQRHTTIYRVTESIVRFQKDFFDTGSVARLKPLITRDVAEDIQMNESTVRRVTNNKYVETPHGVFELKFFFDKVSIDTIDGRKMASKAVKELIKDIIKSENKERPYSDQKITDVLRNDFMINVNLRTVTKYRESMGFLSSRDRKWPC
jgi:RNA polymerase sigma-54 factor